MSPSQFVAACAAFLFAISPATFAEETAFVKESNVLPRPPAPFAGKLAPTERESTPSYQTPIKAPNGAPNIVVVMTDDVGFGASSTFGGPIPTPNLDRLAARGLKYNEFHTTAICSPTRAALLTGRNHHAVGTGMLADIPAPYPGYTGTIPKTAATIARILRDNGYNTAMFGKTHNVPQSEVSAAGPFDHWPTGMGFEYFYGHISGDTNQWQPALFEGTSPVDGSHRPADYILDKDLANRAIRWLHNQKAAAPDKPFFMYYALGSGHAPHQAPKEWIDKFRGKFDAGWDKQRESTLTQQNALGIVPANTALAARPAVIPAWDGLSADEKRVNARYMEVYAGMLAYQDAQVGRLFKEIERMGLSGNTLVIFIEGDNGASAEGGASGTLNELAHLQHPDEKKEDTAWLARNLDIMGGPNSYQGYPSGWAFAMNTPFPWVKQMASHLGGVRNGLVISWPERIKQQGQVRTQYHHIIDIMPTLLEAARIKAPSQVDGIAQQRIDGTSMLYSFDAAQAPSTRRTQYYEIQGNRAIYHDGWLANTTPRNMPWELTQPRSSSDVNSYQWELYDLSSDYAQTRNLAASEPARLKEMQAVFDTEAKRNNVYPIMDSGMQFRAMQMMRAAGTFKTQYVYWGRDISLPNMKAPPIFNLPFIIEADIDVPKNGANGVIVAAGSIFGGWSFYLSDGKPIAYAAASQLPGDQFRVAATKALATGKNKLRFAFDDNTLTIFANNIEVARATIPRTAHIMAGTGETFDIGRDTNTPVTDEYQHEGMFTGDIERVQVDMKVPMKMMLKSALNRLILD